MIINIRGTSGSGKTTIVKTVMASLEPYGKIAVNIPKRRNPIGYWFGPKVPRILAVPGHYETACGGCDTISGYDQIFDYVKIGHEGADHCLFEGLLLSEESKRTIQLDRQFPGKLLVIQLTTPESVCLDSIRARREARGDTRELNPSNTVNRIRTIDRVCDFLKQEGVNVEQHDRDSAMHRVMEIIHGSL